jgi:hypothetical protein
MSESSRFHGRRAATLDSRDLQVVVLEEGGHLAAVVDKATGISPLWVPPWPSIEPSAFGPAHHAQYGAGADGRLLAGIMGHNLCLDIFGGPSDEEAAAGLTAHGEASVVRYDIAQDAGALTLSAVLPMAQLAVRRRLDLDGRRIRVRETVENLTGTDRPVGWTQHVTLGPPFLERGRTEFRVTATRSKVFESAFGPADACAAGAVFDWPLAPAADGGQVDLRRLTDAEVSGGYTAHLMDPSARHASFVAWAPGPGLAFGYAWRRTDFPWLGIWDENRSRPQPPWNGATLTRGLEFGVSPFPETRRAMIERGRLFDTPTFRWIPARSRVEVEYWISLWPASSIPDAMPWPGSD